MGYLCDDEILSSGNQDNERLDSDGLAFGESEYFSSSSKV